MDDLEHMTWQDAQAWQWLAQAWQAQNQPDETSDEEGNITPDNKSADDNETMPELADAIKQSLKGGRA